MRINFLLFLCFFVSTSSFGQKVEFVGQLNTGLSSFTGEWTAGSTTMQYIINPENTHGYTLNPYGNKFAVSYGAPVQVQRVTSKNYFLGMQAGAESLRSRIAIGGVNVIESTQYSASLEHKDTSGKTISKNDFVNLHPFIGQRVATGAVDFDFFLDLKLALV